MTNGGPIHVTGPLPVATEGGQPPSAPKIVFGVPTTDGSFDQSFFDLWEAMRYKYRLCFVRTECSYIDWSRNLIVKNGREAVLEATGELPDGYFFVDQDQVVPTDALDRLLAVDADVIGAFVVRKRPPHIANWGMFGETPASAGIKLFHSGDIVDVDFVGMGCTLIRSHVIEKIEEPWFDIDVRTSAWIGEDVHFCRKVKEAGMRVVVDTGLHVGHTGAVVWPTMYGDPNKDAERTNVASTGVMK